MGGRGEHFKVSMMLRRNIAETNKITSVIDLIHLQVNTNLA
jgi:hypothetical protein